MKGIPICLITDNNYVLPSLVTILSIYRNRDPETTYSVYLITTQELTKENKKAIEECGMPVTIVEAGYNKIYEEIALLPTTHVTVAALNKFNLPEMFPQYDKILYLDTDILVLKDLTAFFNTGLDYLYAAVVEGFSANLFSTVHFEHNLNSGVMLLNLKKMREDKIPQKLLDYRLHGDNYFVDQDAFNAIFEGRVKLMPITYNLMYTSAHRFTAQEICSNYGIPEMKSWSELVCASTILHYNSIDKPWKYIDIWMGVLWDIYYNELPKNIKNKYKLKRTLNLHHKKVDDISFVKFYFTMMPEKEIPGMQNRLDEYCFLARRKLEYFACGLRTISVIIEKVITKIREKSR